jgi:hypothetical protein
MSGSSLPQLPEKPSWFTTTFTSWEAPSDIPCAKRLPRNTLSVGKVSWSFCPGMDRRDRYELSTNRGRRNLILWAGGPNESDSSWTFTPVAYGPAKSAHGETIDEWSAALHLLVEAWKGEKEQTFGFEPPQEVYGALAGEDFAAVAREVWPELWADVAGK